MLDTGRAYRVAPKVSVRPEKFGGLVYRYDNRALYFLHSKPLVELLTELDGERSLRENLDDFVGRNGLGLEQKKRIEAALAQLEKKGVICEL